MNQSFFRQARRKVWSSQNATPIPKVDLGERFRAALALAFFALFAGSGAGAEHAGDSESHTVAQAPDFSMLDVFELEWAVSPEISPDSKSVVYRRAGFDVMQDRRRGSLWILDTTGAEHQKLTDFEGDESQPSWSPSGDRIAYVRSASETDGAEIYVQWVSTGRSARVSRLPKSPRELRWSPDGSSLAFVMDVAAEAPSFAKRPAMPEGAKWADAPRVTDRLYHEADGRGYLKPAFSHVFLVPADGGSARQITHGDFHHRNPAWSSDGATLVCSGNRKENWQFDYRNSELYRIDLASGEITALTDRSGPDAQPAFSPDGEHLAWLGYADKRQAFQPTQLRLAASDGSQVIDLLSDLDRSVQAFHWSADGQGIFFQFDDHGRTRIGYSNLSGEWEEYGTDLGGTSIGRPYAGGSFSVSSNNTIAYTYTRPEFPAEVALVRDRKLELLTKLNDDLLSQRQLGETRELRWKSSFDQREVQGWITLPPDFDPANEYPLLVENHGGPISNYGERFSPEMQLYAAAGYVVFFPNARGSTSYGEEFANLLYHNYPGQDYDDTLSGVDAVIQQGFIDEQRLFVTGGSAGGIMTAWIIGKTDRFRAAAVIKPVMNWYSKTLNADNWFWYYHTRYPGTPWTNPDDYLRFSPISLVGNVSTPTLVMVGLSDLRTPPSQAKQLYHALAYRKVPTALVELPGASHFIARKPSQLIDKVGNILGWFEQYDDKGGENTEAEGSD
ncbi:MAG: S9 family peptidase [Pseudomonadota bacterium]